MTLFQRLGIKDINPGTAIGSQWLLAAGLDHASNEGLLGKNPELLSSYCPNDNSLLAKVEPTTTAQLEQVIAAAQQEFLTWRSVPAPKRG